MSWGGIIRILCKIIFYYTMESTLSGKNIFYYTMESTLSVKKRELRLVGKIISCWQVQSPMLTLNYAQCFKLRSKCLKSDLRLETKGSQFVSGYWLCAEVSSLLKSPV